MAQLVWFVFWLTLNLVQLSFQQTTWMYEMRDAVQAISSQNTSLRSNWSICYPNIGCFNSSGPMAHTGLSPSTPQQIGIQYYAYTAEKVTTPVLIDMGQPDSWKVVKQGARVGIIIHGYGMSYKSYGFINLKDALLMGTAGQIGTVISVNWKEGARMGSAHNFTQACTNAQIVGRQVAYLMNRLQVPPSMIYCLGYSLGGHVCGFAGRYSRVRFGRTFGRITGLDPNAALFEEYPRARLNKGDATFVDIIHTSYGSEILRGQLGMKEAVGHVDFFPNQGKVQPKCSEQPNSVCSHFASVEYYVASLAPEARKWCIFNGTREETHKRKHSQWTEMGFFAEQRPNVTGKVFLTTTNTFPYCYILSLRT